MAVTLTTFLLLPLAGLVVCAVTYAWTTLRYKASLASTSSLQTPLRIPYTIPWLGSAPAFLNRKPGAFYKQLQARYPAVMGHQAGASTLLLGGQEMNILTSPTAVQAFFKLKAAAGNRDTFNRDVMVRACGMPASDYAKYSTVAHLDSTLSHEYALRQGSANELARKFVSCFHDQLTVFQQQQQQQQDICVDLYSWLQPLVFRASTTALLGAHIHTAYPDFPRDFALWDREFLTLVFGLPRFLQPDAHAARERALDGMQRWVEAVDRASGGAKPDPSSKDAQPWEPHWGSRLVRARQALWCEAGMSTRGRASLELGLTFGLASNAIPIAGWMLMHLLDPRKPGLLARVRAEVEQVAAAATAAASGTTGKGELETLSAQALAGMPLLQAFLHETLRLHTDVFPLKELFEDVKLPLDGGVGGKEAAVERWLLLKKGSTVAAPSLVNHHDASHFVNPPADVFSAERWLVPTESGKYVFSSAADGGRMWPWGGGKTICPGRVFAKQEVLSIVALVLLMFDVVPVDDEKHPYRIPSPADTFPGSGGMVPGGDVRVYLKPRV